MEELIKIKETEFRGEQRRTVNARDLYDFLGVGRDFSTWIKNRIEQFDFVEGSDFGTISRSPVQGCGNRGAAIEYFITLDMAKELSMVERNERGKQARQYFIECENRLKTIDPMKMLNDPAALRGYLLAYSEKILEMQPKADAFDRITVADGEINITNAAKALGITPKRLFNWMRTNTWIYRRPGGKGNVAYQERIKQGYLTHKVTTVTQEGVDRIFEQVLVTAKGLSHLAKIIASESRSK